jgi:hypothetical protein
VTLQSRVFDSVAIPLGPESLTAGQQADIVVGGLDHTGPSFELRIFLNNPGADAHTQPTDERGYAGSIYVYGGGQPPASFDTRSGSDPRLPMTRSVRATEAVQAAAAVGPEMTVTLVPVAFQTPLPAVDLAAVRVSVLAHE